MPFRPQPAPRGLGVRAGAWVLLGTRQRAHGSRKGPSTWRFLNVNVSCASCLDQPGEPICDGTSLGVTVSDLLYVALTIVVFAVLLLILKGVERFER